MPDHVTNDQCETRRNHCGEAMVNTMRRQEAQFTGFLKRIEDQITPMVVKTAEVGERCKSNTHRLNWAWGILAGLLVAGATMLIKMIVGGQ